MRDVPTSGAPHAGCIVIAYTVQLLVATSHPIHHALPPSIRCLPPKFEAGIPGGLVDMIEPAPVRGVAQEQMRRDAESGSEMGNGCVDGDGAVELFQDSCGFCEVV
jgi:hypothetical protein